MAMEYYSPKYYEFHISFEFEELTSWEDFTWEKRVFQDGDSYYELQEVRVKTLDKEDVEELGFKCYDSDLPNTIYFKKGGVELMAYTRWGNTFFNGVKIKINDNMVFSGIIKNKSELKRLLTQLGI